MKQPNVIRNEYFLSGTAPKTLKRVLQPHLLQLERITTVALRG